MTKEFRFGLKQRIYNRNMRLARIKLGYSQKILAGLAGVNVNIINSYESFRGFPSKIETAKRIADILEIPLESIFPLWLRKLKIKSFPETIEERSISLEEMISLKRISPEGLMLAGHEEEFKKLNHVFLREQIKKVLDSLPEREKRVLELRLGLGDNEIISFRKIGQKIGVTPERVRQIQFRALGRIRKNLHQFNKLRESYYLDP